MDGSSAISSVRAPSSLLTTSIGGAAAPRSFATSAAYRFEHLLESVKIMTVRVYNVAMATVFYVLSSATLNSWDYGRTQNEEYWHRARNDGSNLKAHLWGVINPDRYQQIVDGVAPVTQPQTTATTQTTPPASPVVDVPVVSRTEPVVTPPASPTAPTAPEAPATPAPVATTPTAPAPAAPTPTTPAPTPTAPTPAPAPTPVTVRPDAPAGRGWGSWVKGVAGKVAGAAGSIWGTSSEIDDIKQQVSKDLQKAKDDLLKLLFTTIRDPEVSKHAKALLEGAADRVLRDQQYNANIAIQDLVDSRFTLEQVKEKVADILASHRKAFEKGIEDDIEHFLKSGWRSALINFFQRTIYIDLGSANDAIAAGNPRLTAEELWNVRKFQEQIWLDIVKEAEIGDESKKGSVEEKVEALKKFYDDLKIDSEHYAKDNLHKFSLIKVEHAVRRFRERLEPFAIQDWKNLLKAKIMWPNDAGVPQPKDWLTIFRGIEEQVKKKAETYTNKAEQAEFWKFWTREKPRLNNQLLGILRTLNGAIPAALATAGITPYESQEFERMLAGTPVASLVGVGATRVATFTAVNTQQIAIQTHLQAIKDAITNFEPDTWMVRKAKISWRMLTDGIVSALPSWETVAKVGRTTNELAVSAFKATPIWLTMYHYAPDVMSTADQGLEHFHNDTQWGPELQHAAYDIGKTGLYMGTYYLTPPRHRWVWTYSALTMWATDKLGWTDRGIPDAVAFMAGTHIFINRGAWLYRWLDRHYPKAIKVFHASLGVAAAGYGVYTFGLPCAFPFVYGDMTCYPKGIWKLMKGEFWPPEEEQSSSWWDSFKFWSSSADNATDTTNTTNTTADSAIPEEAAEPCSGIFDKCYWFPPTKDTPADDPATVVVEPFDTDMSDITEMPGSLEGLNLTDMANITDNTFVLNTTG